MNKYMDYKTVCLNGTIKAGDEIMTTPLNDYPTMRGRVLYINPEGSPEQKAETCNEGCDDEHVVLYTYNLSKKRVKEIEADFSDMYGQKKRIEDIALDDDIEDNHALININDLSDKDKKRIDKSEISACQVAFEVLANYAIEKAKEEHRDGSGEKSSDVIKGAGNSEHKCRCGNGYFFAHQLCRHDIIIDGDGYFQENIEIYDSETPYGTFTCTACGDVYEELHDIPQSPKTDESAMGEASRGPQNEL